jgi:hypothetical protein
MRTMAPAASTIEPGPLYPALGRGPLRAQRSPFVLEAHHRESGNNEGGSLADYDATGFHSARASLTRMSF